MALKQNLKLAPPGKNSTDISVISAAFYISVGRAHMYSGTVDQVIGLTIREASHTIFSGGIQQPWNYFIIEDLICQDDNSGKASHLVSASRGGGVVFLYLSQRHQTPS